MGFSRACGGGQGAASCDGQGGCRSQYILFMLGRCGWIRAATGASTPDVHEACAGSGHGHTSSATAHGQCLRGAASISGGKGPPLPTAGASGVELCLSPAAARGERAASVGPGVAREQAAARAWARPLRAAARTALVARVVVDVEGEAALARAVGPDVAPDSFLAALGGARLHRRPPKGLVRVGRVGADAAVRRARLAALLLVLHLEGDAPGERVLRRVAHVRPRVAARAAVVAQSHWLRRRTDCVHMQGRARGERRELLRPNDGGDEGEGEPSDDEEPSDGDGDAPHRRAKTPGG